MRTFILLFATFLIAGCGEKFPKEAAVAVDPLGDSAIEKALEVAVELKSLQKRNDLYYPVNKSDPYSGWLKDMYDSGQVFWLVRFKDGRQDGSTIKFHENGQKWEEEFYKEGELISTKYWNSKGEEVADALESDQYPPPPR